MDRSEYRAITTGQGAKLRAVFADASAKHPETSRAAITKRFAEAGVGPDHPRHRDLLAAYKQLAERVRNGEPPYIVRQLGDDVTLEWVRKLGEDDDLFGDDPLPATDDTDYGEIAEVVHDKAKRPGESDQARAKRREAEAERKRLTDLGVELR